ncbi:hypothetical protein B0H14DRAFT_2615380 [Mycena olivaceomarginata]|nr:hypothetical protein B0H14DRAFT_2615380 [Mycena olivaceomarginata]
MSPPKSLEQAPEPHQLDADLASNTNKMLTQNGQLLDDFAEGFNNLGEYLLEREADDNTSLLCECSDSGKNRTTKCFDCAGYPAACSDFFVRAHLQNPFHWAEVWDPMAGFFVRHDISKLEHITQLGHNGGPCKTPIGERFFTAVDGNGVHSTRLAFCGCKKQRVNEIRQLMRAGLFPATKKDPHTAFTINMLKEFQLHNFESKKAAYDYLGAIRRLSDNSFTADIARSGHFHGIDDLLPHRPPGNLLVWCPACPEPGLNPDPNCPQTPAHLRHLNQSQRTLFSKNTDPDDVSLCAGKAYFPLDSTYQDYLKSVSTSTEKATCNYLKVVNKQDKKKFKNMAITGTVNCQYSHVFILSCVDLPHAERIANADYSLAMSLRNHKPTDDFSFKLQLEVDDVDEAATYDIACEYVINLEKRFEKHFPDQLKSIRKMRWGVPAFQHCWPEANQLGPHVRQMNLGHRQDTMINHHGDWNYKKTMKIASDLAEDLQTAKQKYLEKRNHYINLSISFADRVTEWQKAPRISYKQGKVAVSVYKHRDTKVPSQKSIYQKMLAEDDNFGFTLVPKSKIAQFLELGFRVQDSHVSDARRKEISSRTSKLRDQMTTFQQSQKHFMAKVGDKVAAQTACALAIEDEKLFLPSDVTEIERQAMDVVALGMEEAKWREGQAFDILRALQHIVKAIGSLQKRKFKNERQQKQNSRAGDQIAEVMKRRNRPYRWAVVASTGTGHAGVIR